MASSLDVLRALNRGHQELEKALGAATFEDRTLAVAFALHATWPGAHRYACQLQREGNAYLSVVDEAGNPCPQAVKSAREVLVRCEKIGKPLEGTWVTQELASQGRHMGWLAVEARDAGETAQPVLAPLLEAFARVLALRLELETQTQKRQALVKDLEALTRMADLGELVGPVLHEFSNFVNLLLLHVAVMRTKAPELLQPELTDLRRQGNAITSVLTRMQQSRRGPQPEPQPIDVNRVVREAVTTLTRSHPETGAGDLFRLNLATLTSGIEMPATEGVPLSLALAGELPCVQGSAVDLKRLCSFLVKNAVAAAELAGGRVTVRTEARPPGVVLHVEDTGPAITPEQLAGLFDHAENVGPRGMNSLELAACKTISKRLQGAIRAENRAAGGVVVCVELPAGQP